MYLATVFSDPSRFCQLEFVASEFLSAEWCNGFSYILKSGFTVEKKLWATILIASSTRAKGQQKRISCNGLSFNGKAELRRKEQILPLKNFEVKKCCCSAESICWFISS